MSSFQIRNLPDLIVALLMGALAGKKVRQMPLFMSSGTHPEKYSAKKMRFGIELKINEARTIIGECLHLFGNRMVKK